MPDRTSERFGDYRLLRFLGEGTFGDVYYGEHSYQQIAAALQYAHDQRRIHRDVKPENILFGSNTKLLLSDLGLAVVAHNPASQRTEDKSGTALYMAPEQWQGKPVPATDQYALGIVVYEWLCGERPFIKRRKLVEFVFPSISCWQPINMVTKL